MQIPRIPLALAAAAAEIPRILLALAAAAAEALQFGGEAQQIQAHHSPRESACDWQKSSVMVHHGSGRIRTGTVRKLRYCPRIRADDPQLLKKV
eukprot:3160737-Amphidinium_carterae.1